MFHSLVIGHNHHQVDSLTAQLKSPATTCNFDWGRGAPSPVRGPASGNALTVTSAESYCDLDHRGNHCDALSLIHHLVGDRLVRCPHDLFQNLGCVFDSFFDIRFIVLCPSHAVGHEQQPSAEH